jgi:hypothetical protein
VQQPFFIVGLGRSGTTYLYRMLAAHPRVGLTNEARVADFLHFCDEYAGTPAYEPHAHNWQAPMTLFGLVGRPYSALFRRVFTEHAQEALEGFYRRAFAGRHITHWGDKLTRPSTAVALQAAYPHAKFLLLVRDPRDVVCSVRTFGKREDVRQANPFFGDASLDAICENWHNTYRGLPQYLRQPLPLRYEDLVREPSASMEAVQSYLGLQPILDLAEQVAAKQLFDTHATSRSPRASIGRWRDELAEADVARIESICAATMRRFGYELSGA